ncbi:MAG: saccharopine dehydrogenase NADP-binding domain-containing protein, partial [Elusimicrobiales bacterium]
MTDFNKRILFVGYGAVAQCALPMLLKLVKVPARNITVLDFEDRRRLLKPWLAKGVKFVRARVTRTNLGALLGKYLSEGDMLLDLAWNIGANDILQWCHDKGILYLNASTELWDPYEGAENKHPTERTLYHRHMAMRRMTARWKTPGPTAVIEHGANPGLISHFAKKGLLDIAFRLLDERKVKGAKAEKLRQLTMDLAFNELSRELGVKVIHVSERDTQISNKPKRLG